MTVLWGVSFDATAMSGVVVEFIKIAKSFAGQGYRVHLDLGYDIKADKGRFFQPYRHERTPDWITLDRVDGVEHIAGYDQDFVAATLESVRRNEVPDTDRITSELADAIVRTWEDRGVTLVMVENGTLPENVAYTKALYQAISTYGATHGLGRYVLWRDHDLMWQSEPDKYGSFPYPATPPMVNSPHIHYFALHEEARRRTLEWMPHLRALDVLPNTFTPPGRAGRPDFREHFGLPEDVKIIARLTRIIPQKRIDRDLHLLARLPGTWLFVAGDTEENPEETRRLRAVAAELRVPVVFGGVLEPCESTGDGFSVRDLLAHADLVSFLTSYDYESYGNPIGEAIAAGVPYIASRYALYDTVYAGFEAPVLDILADDLPTEEFARQVLDLMTNAERRAEVVAHNQRLGMHNRAAADELVSTLFPPPMGEDVRLSVVLPVYNEAANIDEVLQSLHGQDGIDPGMYEIVLVDNNSTDDTVARARRFAERSKVALHVVGEREQGVACARRTGMEFAARRSRNRKDPGERFYLVSADADCRVDRRWLAELFAAMEEDKAAIGVCDYYYNAEHFVGRPRLWEAIQRTLRCRAVTFSLFGGFPDGKGFAVEREAYEDVGGIEICYQLQNGRFVNHLSDDWDFGIKVRGSGYDITYAPRSRVEINPRRVNHAIDEVITGRAYGNDGIIVMRDIRPEAPPKTEDLTEAEALQAWEFSIKDFSPKNTILPVLLTPSLLDDDAVLAFFGEDLASRLGTRIAEIKEEMRVVDFVPIHSYKTPSYRLYFEFRDEIFARLRAAVGEDIGYPPPLPECFDDVPEDRFAEFVKYYCEDRESGEAHNYFGNGGVF
ncbi:Glycosyl transferases group 1 [Lentzea xinjiangensis]|uniref:Glycosyl transferases group 1 n=1 Tax=Lentzea xinjiangensis TaxID=402600 RepID=A0A1H9J2G3_9PSEU|nr:glycosyltransferase [Lentzea xinjiangensis]SEQ81034.1 Glycosyl transferases group 1 [Lentzea xinjiangensis]